MSLSSPCTDFQLDCYRDRTGAIWWYYSYLRNGRRHDSYYSYTNRWAAKTAMREAMKVETAG